MIRSITLPECSIRSAGISAAIVIGGKTEVGFARRIQPILAGKFDSVLFNGSDRISVLGDSS